MINSFKVEVGMRIAVLQRQGRVPMHPYLLEEVIRYLSSPQERI